jgi:hypothetical protein
MLKCASLAAVCALMCISCGCLCTANQRNTWSYGHHIGGCWLPCWLDGAHLLHVHAFEVGPVPCRPCPSVQGACGVAVHCGLNVLGSEKARGVVKGLCLNHACVSCLSWSWKVTTSETLGGRPREGGAQVEAVGRWMTNMAPGKQWLPAILRWTPRHRQAPPTHG